MGVRDTEVGGSVGCGCVIIIYLVGFLAAAAVAAVTDLGITTLGLSLPAAAVAVEAAPALGDGGLVGAIFLPFAS